MPPPLSPWSALLPAVSHTNTPQWHEPVDARAERQRLHPPPLPHHHTAALSSSSASVPVPIPSNSDAHSPALSLSLTATAPASSLTLPPPSLHNALSSSWEGVGSSGAVSSAADLSSLSCATEDDDALPHRVHASPSAAACSHSPVSPHLPTPSPITRLIASETISQRHLPRSSGSDKGDLPHATAPASSLRASLSSSPFDSPAVLFGRASDRHSQSPLADTTTVPSPSQSAATDVVNRRHESSAPSPSPSDNRSIGGPNIRGGSSGSDPIPYTASLHTAQHSPHHTTPHHTHHTPQHSTAQHNTPHHTYHTPQHTASLSVPTVLRARSLHTTNTFPATASPVITEPILSFAAAPFSPPFLDERARTARAAVIVSHSPQLQSTNIVSLSKERTNAGVALTGAPSPYASSTSTGTRPPQLLRAHSHNSIPLPPHPSVPAALLSSAATTTATAHITHPSPPAPSPFDSSRLVSDELGTTVDPVAPRVAQRVDADVSPSPSRSPLPLSSQAAPESLNSHIREDYYEPETVRSTLPL